MADKSPNGHVSLASIGGAIEWDAMGDDSYTKAVSELLGLGKGPDDVFARGRISEGEQKASVILLARSFRLAERVKRAKAKKLGIDWPAMPDAERAVKLNLALSISREGQGRNETVSALIGAMVRRVAAAAKKRDRDGIVRE